MQYLLAFALTQVVEAPIYVLLLSRLCGVRPRTAVAAAILVNAVSHPLFTFGLEPAADHLLAPTAAVLVGEVAVCALEGTLLAAWLRRNTPELFAASLIANSASFAAGLMLFTLVPGSSSI